MGKRMLRAGIFSPLPGPRKKGRRCDAARDADLRRPKHGVPLAGALARQCVGRAGACFASLSHPTRSLCQAAFFLAVLWAGLARGADRPATLDSTAEAGGGRFLVIDLVPPPPAPATAQDGPQLPRGGTTPPESRPLRHPHAVGDETEGLLREEVVPATGEEYTVDLATVLRLAESENPAIALGREAIQEALALQLKARAMMVPSLNGGAMYHLHQGTIQASDGEIVKLTSQSVYFGAGDWTVGSQTLAIPGVNLFGHIGDAYFAPLAAHQVVSSRLADSRGIENTVLLDVARRYLDLVGSRAALEALRRSEDNLQQIVHDTAAFARTGQGRVGDYNRARTTALLLHSREEGAQETVAVASADLARTLHLDPSLRLTTAGDSLEPVQLVDPTYRVEELIQIALNARPEAAARAADIAAAEFRLKQEYARPWLPLLSVGYSAGGFGAEGSIAGLPFTTSGRTDFDVYAVWTLQNLGFGNAAVQKERRAERDDAIARRGLILNKIGREVADAFAQFEAKRQQLDLARGRFQTASAGAREEIDRTRGGEGFPLEAVNSINLLVDARDEFIVALVGYDLAQFELFVAIGETPSTALPDPLQSGTGPAGKQ
jgi:outer membrane protein TolC